MAAKRKKSRRPARKRARAAKARKRGLFSRLWRFGIGIIFVTAVSVVGLVLVFSVVPPPPGIYMSAEAARLGEVKRKWVALEDFSDVMARSVVAAEDANFCLHNGIDFDALRDAIEDGGRRGASTLTQQVAKNVFLWHDRSMFRKGLEAGFALLIELLWTKERIVEVYLNVAEFDAGVFGAAAGAKHYFGAKPDRITRLQAARLAAILPNPKRRSASRPTSFVKSRTRAIISGADTILADGRADCFTQG